MMFDYSPEGYEAALKFLEGKEHNIPEIKDDEKASLTPHTILIIRKANKLLKEEMEQYGNKDNRIL